MSNDIEVLADEDSYNQRLHGYYGEFGTGAESQIFYLQSAIQPSELDRVTLISEIPGSETWSVRDLFQREVDNERVSNGLMPYFRDDSKVKFFNPLTLTVLPIHKDSHEVLTAMPVLSKSKILENNREWTVLESPGYYRYRYLEKAPYASVLEWDDSSARIVAIDGQHRLSALKRMLRDTDTSEERMRFLKWTIPVVIFSVRALTHSAVNTRILDVVRSIFIYINTQARTPNEARQILLTDESINAVCTQELLEYSHENDVKPINARDPSKMPLLFYDWRGQEEQGRRIYAAAAVKTIEEIRDWLREYLLGEDFSPEQETVLGVQPIDPLHEAFVKGRLTATSATEVRQIFCKNVLPGLSHLLENFAPYREYIVTLRAIENEYNIRSDVARHAFHQLRFGTHHGDPSIDTQIRAHYGSILTEIMDAKAKIPQLLSRDIGMRGVIAAFSECSHYYARGLGSSSSWLEYSIWFSERINEVYQRSWFSASSGPKKDLLLHVVHDHNDTVVNYRLDQIHDAFGAFLVLLVCAYGRGSSELPDQGIWLEVWEDASERLTGTLLRGYKKQVRVVLKEQYPNGGKELTDAIKKEAAKRVDKHIAKLEKELDKIIAGA